MSKWHAREHGKALKAMQMLTLEERGAYNTCLDLIYEREGPIPDDPRWLAGWMGVSVRKWGVIRAALIIKCKLFEVNLNGVPSLMNERAIIELESLAKRTDNLRENGAKGGKKSAETRAKDNKNNDEQQAKAEAPLKLITSTDTVIPPVTSNEVTAPKGAEARGTRIPESWAPDWGVAHQLGLTQQQAQNEADRFLDYWRAVPGAKGRKTDWTATWRNWCRSAADRLPGRPHERPSPQQQRFIERHANMAAAAEGARRLVAASQQRRGDGLSADPSGEDWLAS